MVVFLSVILSLLVLNLVLLMFSTNHPIWSRTKRTAGTQNKISAKVRGLKSYEAEYQQAI